MRNIVDLSIGVAHHGDEEVEEEEEDDHDEESPVDLADDLVVAVLQGVPAGGQLSHGHEEGHDHALCNPFHRVCHAVLVVSVAEDFSSFLIDDFLQDIKITSKSSASVPTSTSSTLPSNLKLWNMMKNALKNKRSYERVTRVQPVHTSYLSQTPQTCLCKKKLPGVNLYRFNAKSWRFFTDLTQKIGVFKD